MEKEAAAVRLKIEENKRQCAIHACVLYDAMRMYGAGCRAVGWGTREASLRAGVHGLDFTPFMPPAMGEVAFARRVKEEKLRRAAQRKNAALAAMQRERMRRNVDEVEKARMLREKAAQMKKQMEEEESKLFGRAFDALCNAREERKSSQELNALLQLWEDLSILCSTRYPNSLKSVVCQNNFACVCLEMLGFDHPRGIDAMAHLNAATTTVMSLLTKASHDHLKVVWRADAEVEKTRALAHEEEGMSRPEQEQTFEIDTGSGDKSTVESQNVKIHQSNVGNIAEHEMDPEEREEVEFRRAMADRFFPKEAYGVAEEQKSPCLMMLQNEISFFRFTNNVYQLQRSFPKLEGIRALYYQLSSAEQERVMSGVARSVEKIPVLTYGIMRVELSATLAEVDRVRAEEQAALEAALAPPVEEVSAITDSDLLNVDDGKNFEEVMEMSKEALRLKRREAYERQRVVDAKRRRQISRQRNKLYAMIRTDEISRIFLEKANGDALARENIQWGDGSNSKGTGRDFLALTPRSDDNDPSEAADAKQAVDGSSRSRSSSRKGSRKPSAAKPSPETSRRSSLHHLDIDDVSELGGSEMDMLDSPMPGKNNHSTRSPLTKTLFPLTTDDGMAGDSGDNAVPFDGGSEMEPMRGRMKEKVPEGQEHQQVQESHPQSQPHGHTKIIERGSTAPAPASSPAQSPASTTGMISWIRNKVKGVKKS